MHLQSLPVELFVEILKALVLLEHESPSIMSESHSDHSAVKSRSLLGALLPYMLVSPVWRNKIEGTIYSSVRLLGPAKVVLFARAIVQSRRGLLG
ncbi:hypothetical protein DL93DRAFT_2075277 [Clavulina sp. PMI_390]|nr:hypothetical protein DL93DRAFT_2075277 [Clavulina sp. PMI_390]